ESKPGLVGHGKNGCCLGGLVEQEGCAALGIGRGRERLDHRYRIERYAGSAEGLGVTGQLLLVELERTGQLSRRGGGRMPDSIDRCTGGREDGEAPMAQCEEVLGLEPGARPT